MRIIDCQPFSHGGGIQGMIGGDQGYRVPAGLVALPEDFEGGGQLHSIIGTQRVRIRQPHGIVEQSGRDLDDSVATGKMLAEAMEDRRCFRGGERPAFPAAGNGGGDLDGGECGPDRSE